MNNALIDSHDKNDNNKKSDLLFLIKKYIYNFISIENKPISQDFLTIFLYFVRSTLSQCAIICKKWWILLINNSLSNKNSSLFFVFILGFINLLASSPFSIILVLPLTFGSLFYILDKQRNLKVSTQLKTIFFFLFGHFVGIFWWFFLPLTTDFLHLFWLTPFAIFGLPFVITMCFMPFFTIGIVILKKIERKKRNFNYDFWFVIVFLLSWFFGDYIRGHLIFGGFPWMLFGHFVSYSFAFQSVKLLGIDLYSILFLAFVISFYVILFKKNKILQTSAIFIICFWLLNCIIGGFIVLFLPKDKISQTIVGSQINYPASLDYENHAIEILNKNFELISWTASSNREMIKLMPESAINIHINSGDKLAKKIGKIVANDKSILLAGGIYFEGFTPYNVIYSINSDGHIVSMYKKQKLVPFGEYIPFRKFMPSLTRAITNNMIDFATDGENDLYTFHRNLPIIYPIVCYESIFPDYIKKRVNKSRISIKQTDKWTTQFFKEDRDFKYKTLKERGEIIVNLTNDAWLKGSIGAYQHFLMTRYLAVSVGLPVIRLSNNGISAFIDKYGRIVEKTKLNKEGILFVPGGSK